MPHDSNIITIYQSWAGKIFIQAPMREQQALDIASLIKEGHIVVLNLELMRLYVVGGGGCMIQNFGEFFDSFSGKQE